MRRALRGGLVAALVAGVVTVTSCGSDPGGGPPDPVVDLGALDVGGYRTEPKDYAPKDHRSVARIFEAERLGAMVPVPSELDARLRFNRGGDIHAFLEPDVTHPSPMYTWLKKDGFAQDAAGFVAGFASSGRSESDERISFALSVSVLLFESEQQAAAAGTALAARGWQAEASKVVALSSARHPRAVVSWQPEAQVLTSWYATGKFVIVATADSRENRTLKISDQDLLSTLADNGTAAVAERVRSFEPTPPDQLDTVPLDPEGLLRISLPRPEGDEFRMLPGVYEPTAFVHLSEDADKARKRLEEFGVDRVSVNGSWLYRTRDAAAAEGMLAEESAGKFRVAVSPPAGLSNAKCTKYRGPEESTYPFYCYVRFGRYMAMSWGLQLPDVQQRISAQYTLLARNK
ncbi:hypothetical protein [Nocardia sp. NPDC057668]|uniref:DUF7373 family lipoprotein n=1 Tax=Nocardia sp. NPDC057668 TaxID=3346202 RepID=UPI003672013E